MVTYEAADKFFGPPQDALAAAYPGGNGPLTFKVTGSVQEISNQGGEGVYFGTVTALYAYPGDPPSPHPICRSMNCKSSAISRRPT